MKINNYEGVGGPSAFIEFEGGEKLRVEPHEGSFGMTWESGCTVNEVAEFARELTPTPLLDDLSWVVTGEKGSKHYKIPTREALAIMQSEEDVRFVRLEAQDTVLTWRAVLEAEGNSEIGYGCINFYPERIKGLLGKTAIEAIKEQSDEVIAEITPYIDRYKPDNPAA